MRRLYCRNCGYELTPLFQGEVAEAPCPECGSIAQKRRANATLNAWWWRPAFYSICAGTIPVIVGVGAASILDRVNIGALPSVPVPLWVPVGTAVCVLVAFLLFPKDVPGRANFGRRGPFLAMVFLASFAVNVVLLVVCAFVPVLFSIR